jgi:glutamate N-acetyltransferase/amino-acid N-acetyltransferase
MAVRETAAAAAKLVGCAPKQVAVASTGVIGVPIRYEKIITALENLGAAKHDWNSAAKAISTTDTFIKLSTAKAGKANINGIAKGSGMIAPNMATMLGYIFTDAKISAANLQKMLAEINENTFNSISVDSDTSTNDMCLAFATNVHEVDLAEFRNALQTVMLDLAQQIIRDGEGATKFVEIEVTGAVDASDAKKIARSIGNSPILKTAIAGEDANWGRIVMAVGKSGAQVEIPKLKVYIGGVLIAENGAVHPDYREEQVIPHMQGQKIHISVDIGLGSASTKFWTCDLTHAYIDINGDYRS